MVNFFSGNKSAGRKKRDRTRSRNRRAKTKSQSRRKNRKTEREREKKSSQMLTSSSTQAPISPARTPKKERNSGKDHRRKMETSRDIREKDFKEEKEQESENDDDLLKKRSYSAIQKDAPKKVDIRHRDVDEAEMKKFLAKAKESKPQILKELDEKEKILMDRIVKKKYPMKYVRKEKLADDSEDPEFFKPSVGKKSSFSIIVPDDTYEHVPKLEDVLKMAEEKVFVEGKRTPFWTSVMEPDDEDMKHTDDPISIGTDHVEQYQDKKLTLKTPKDTKIILDEWAPLPTLQKRDEDLFHPHLVFSNTVRSLVNVQAELADHEKAVLSRRHGTSNEEATQAEEEICRATFSDEKPTYYGYERANPILTAREALTAELRRREGVEQNSSSSSQNGSETSDSGSESTLGGTGAVEEKEE